MGRIADSALDLLADGPLGADVIGAALARSGATRARDPGAAVRRALSGDPRVLRIPDGRLASVAQALRGLALTTRVGAAERAAGELPFDDDLAPFALAGLGAAVRLPPELAGAEVVRVRLDPSAAPPLGVDAIDPPAPRADDEAALVAAVEDALGGGGSLAPPIAHLATVVAGIGAARPELLRAAGRPLTEVLRGAGYETHLGWVGPAGTAWDDLTDEEVDALEVRVAELMASERTLDAAAAQARLLSVVARHRAERVPAARRGLARVLARAGHGARALEVLVAGVASNDPEDLYEAAVIAHRRGDEVSARRWAATGAAHADAQGRPEVGACLSDLGHDLDAQAAFLRARVTVTGDDGAPPGPEEAERIAGAVEALSRSYLIEALVEEIVAEHSPDEVTSLIGLLAEAGDRGREACLAMSAILPPGLAAAARDAAGPLRPRQDAVAGLMAARPTAAWATSPLDAPDQQQVVVAVSKEAGRISPLVVLVDLEDLGGAVKDAFFLPDMCEPRLRRELLDPMGHVGLPAEPVDLHEAIELVDAALDRTAHVGWRIPSLRHQPVLDRIERWLMRPQRGGAGRHPVPGS